MKAFTRILAVFCLFAGGSAFAQGAQVAFGGLQHDTTLPVEVTADQLQVDQSDGSATFSGNVVIGQGEMRLSAAQVLVNYTTGQDTTGEIEEMRASGGVTLVTGAEAAEAREAVYSIDKGTIVLSGDVILTQGRNALSGERMVVDLRSGVGTMEGRVRTILQSGGQ